MKRATDKNWRVETPEVRVRGISGFLMKLRLPSLTPVWLRYAIATILVAISALVRYSLGAGYSYPFLLFIPAVIVSTLLFDRRTGFFTTFLSTLVILYFFIATPFSLSIFRFHDLEAIILFTLVGLFSVSVIETLRASIDTLMENDKLRNERSRLENDLFHAQKLEAIGRAISILTHDFKNIFYPISGAVDILKTRSSQMDENSQALIKTLDKACIDANRLIQDILVYSSKKKEKLESIALNALILNNLEILRQGVGDSIDIHTQLEENLPNVQLSSELLGRALSNILDNAKDAMPKGGRIIIKTSKTSLSDIDCSLEKNCTPSDYVCLSITDNGVGIPPEIKEQIFEPFFTTKPLGKGTGLGMAMVADFVQNAQGSIAVESSPGKGTTIKIYFPIRNSLVAAPETGTLHTFPARSSTQQENVLDQT